MRLKSGEKKLISQVQNIIGDCKVSMDSRLTQARTLGQWRRMGSADGGRAIYNKLGQHISRMSGYLFSPVDLRFLLEFEDDYSLEMQQQAEVAGRYLTKKFERQDLDIKFSQGIDEALTYGAAVMKLMWGNEGLTGRLLMPWNMGVMDESRNGFQEQEAILEVVYISKEELWRRVGHLENGSELYKKAVKFAGKSNVDVAGESFFSKVVLGGTTPIVQTDTLSTETGGAFDTSSDPLVPQLGPSVQSALIAAYELTVVDDDTGDYTSIQFIEPDILITPRVKKTNLFIQGEQPYTLIQPNPVVGNFWGISELDPMLKLQALLRDRLEDIKKIMGVQYDKWLAFIGFSGDMGESYDSLKQNGWIAQEQPGAKIEDLTPKLPEAAFADINQIIQFMDDISGFQNILSGQGEAGVRSGNHASTLMRTASPRLRDRAILVERQCSELGNKAFELIRAKEAKVHWTTDDDDERKEFLLSAIPDDYRVVVDSHSSSPIYEEDHKQLAMMLLKAGVIEGDSVLDLVHIPMRDLLKDRYRQKQKQQAEFMAKNPELLKKGASRRK
jgi:hypothetical protein